MSRDMPLVSVAMEVLNDVYGRHRPPLVFWRVWVYAELIHPDPQAGMVFLADHSIHKRFTYGPATVSLIVVGQEVFGSPTVRHGHVLTNIEAILIE
jgi:hypothetical protein